jgi:phosphate starvation-inducible protein PhoH and related proteins
LKEPTSQSVFPQEPQKEEADSLQKRAGADPNTNDVARDKMSLDDNVASQMLYGQRNENLRQIERETGAGVHSRGNELTLIGESEAVRLARALLEQLYAMARRGRHLGPEDVKRAATMLRADANTEIDDVFDDTVLVSSRARPIAPKGLAQKRYIEAIRKDDIVFGIGPAGTGKTYLAMAMAVSALMKKEVSRIILARPAVEAGEKLGFLPGDMYAKVNPYLRPLYDALFDMMDMERAARAIERGDIEIAPLGFMRGRTLNDSFVILDEAQNATAEQMKMFLTRLGFHSKVVVTGDITQVDLPPERVSGLIEVREILRDVEGIEFVYFDERDVVRHKLVQDIIKAYDQHQNSNQSSGPSSGATGRRPSPVPHNKQAKPSTSSSPLRDSWGQSH